MHFFNRLLPAVYLVGFTAVSLPGSFSLQWSDNLPDGDTVYVCPASILHLPWNVSATATEEITDIEWYAATQTSQEMIAIYAQGHFLPLASFSGRVRHTQNGGLIMNAMEVTDTGNYSVVVSGHDSSGAFFKSNRTAKVQVVGDLVGNIQVTKEAKAVWNNSDSQFHFVLSCGTFAYSTNPPFDVEWMLPDGATLNSTGYADGTFLLQLANPVKGGNYTCLINEKAAYRACLPKPMMASTDVSSVEGRLAILEAENARLKGDDSQLKNDLDHVQSQLVHYINNTEHRQPVSFHARLQGTGTTTVSAGQPVMLLDVINNQADAFDVSSSKFTAPVNGSYFFAATMRESARHRVNLGDIMVDGSSVCPIQSSDDLDSVSCHAVVSLNAGQKVWLNSSPNYAFRLYGQVTCLTGFLVTSSS